MNIEQPGFVLHKRPYRENSALVTFFTPEYGKINAVIRSARGKSKAASNKAALLQPHQKLRLQWRDKKHTDLIAMQNIEADSLQFPLAGDANICGLYINELLYRLLYPHVVVDTLFAEYQHTLYGLLAAPDRVHQAWVLRQFELALLHEQGLGLVLDYDIHQQPIASEKDYYFYLQNGLVACDEDATQTGLRMSGHCLQALQAKQFCLACQASYKQLLRQILNFYLGGKPIMARHLFIAKT